MARLGSDNLPTIGTMSDIANTLRDQGKVEEAAAMQREVLEKRQRILGHEHPYTIQAMDNLAIALTELGKLDKSAAVYIDG